MNTKTLRTKLATAHEMIAYWQDELLHSLSKFADARMDDDEAADEIAAALKWSPEQAERLLARAREAQSERGGPPG